MMHKKTIIWVLVLIIIAGAGYVAYTKFGPKGMVPPRGDESGMPSEQNTASSTTTGRPQAKINTDKVCEDSLSYTSFTDSASAEVYVADCKAGKHPEVIQKYIDSLNLDDGAKV